MAANVFGMSQSNGKVFLNVYDLYENNDMLYPIGLGLFHSGVQVGRLEYTFAGGAGIYSHEPKQVPAGVKLRESIDMGNFRGSSSDIDKIISQMKPRFSGSDYNILNRNCNTFADEFLQQLIGVSAPPFVNRMAYIGSYFSCLLPENMNQDPTQQQNSAGNVNGTGGGSFSTGSSSGGVFRTGNATNRAQPSQKQPAKFSGAGGVRLGGGSAQSASTGGGSKDESESPTLGLVDRRERMRQAALNRMQSPPSTQN